MTATTKKAAKKTAAKKGPGNPVIKGRSERQTKKIPTPATPGVGDGLHDANAKTRRAGRKDTSDQSETVNQLADREVVAAASREAADLVPPAEDQIQYSPIPAGAEKASSWWQDIGRAWKEDEDLRMSIIAGGLILGLGILLWLVY